MERDILKKAITMFSQPERRNIWAMESHMRAELVIDSLKMAVAHRNPGDSLIFHSDRGVQYDCDDFSTVLKRYEMIQSMSRKGNCWDNACAESFFATLKTE